MHTRLMSKRKIFSKTTNEDVKGDMAYNTGKGMVFKVQAGIYIYTFVYMYIYFLKSYIYT